MAADSVLIVSPNWLGDAVMAMPAVQRFHLDRPDIRLVVLAKPGVAALWRMHAAPDAVVELQPGTFATVGAGRLLRREGFREAYILPNSFRSALIPFLAGIPRRRGTAFHARALMVNDRVRLRDLHHAGTVHQTREYMRVLCVEASGDGLDTGFRPPPGSLFKTLGFPPGIVPVGVIPGAARGPAKRWPHFAEAVRQVIAAHPDVRVLVAGTAGEAALCDTVAAAIGDRALSVAGRTSLPEFASLLGGCRLVLCNDSGGMHLASAAGVPVVAVFGVTDPAATGPIGPNAIVIRPDGVNASRTIPRDSAKATAALASIPPGRVAAACLTVLGCVRAERIKNT